MRRKVYLLRGKVTSTDRASIDFMNKRNRERTILEQAKKEKNIIYGGQSILKQIGTIFARPTRDWDIFSKKPRKSARKTEKTFDKLHGYDAFYVKKAMYPGTHKVMSKGMDGRRGTKDDYGIVDYTKCPKPTPKFIILNGARYRILKEEVKTRRKILKDKAYKFRHGKDREDISRINLSKGKFPKVKLG